jgi:hypothetical protein
MNGYRAQLIEAVERSRVQQKIKEMTDEELIATICTGLGLPPGTTFTDEQLQMIAKHP